VNPEKTVILILRIVWVNTRRLSQNWVNTYVIEFKTVRATETVETAIEKALKQMEEKKYETELLEKGLTRIKKLAIVFNGKDVSVKEA